jgi:2-polyprenyl-3-methyl-5-hydroxy-6-metoxy-1,4-benzoquinol methylase
MPILGAAGYFKANTACDDELSRLRLLEDYLDPQTFRCFDNIGVGEGWRCLEVGAGAGSVARGLAERVGATGKVIAADIDLRFVSDMQAPNVEVRQCDITEDDVEPGHYDLVHSRLLLMHLGDPADVLRRMAEALRPGGWLVTEEIDTAVAGSVDRTHPLAEAFDVCYRQRIEFVLRAGIMDLCFGRIVPALVETLGFVEVGNEGVAHVVHGGEPVARMLAQSFQELDPQLVANGLVTDTQAADARRAYVDPTFLFRDQLMQSVWARKPGIKRLGTTQEPSSFDRLGQDVHGSATPSRSRR